MNLKVEQLFIRFVIIKNNNHEKTYNYSCNCNFSNI